MRLLDALAQEAIDASDEEITGAATDLRMDLNKRESAAFAGLTYFARPRLSDFFDVDRFTSLQAPEQRIAIDSQPKAKVRQRRGKQRQIPSDRKTPSEK